MNAQFVTDAPTFQTAAGATDAQMADLEAFRVLLTEWNEKMNLVGPSALEQFWGRHVWDSAQLLRLAPEARTWADLGAGAGFPGIVLAILLKPSDVSRETMPPGSADVSRETSPHVHLVESMAKRCRFLSEVVSTLNLPATVHNARAEDLQITVDIACARACAPLIRLLGYLRPYLKNGAKAMVLKGRDVESEIAEARQKWTFECRLEPSASDPSGRIVIIEGAVRERRP